MLHQLCVDYLGGVSGTCLADVITLHLTGELEGIDEQDIDDCAGTVCKNPIGNTTVQLCVSNKARRQSIFDLD